MRTQKTRLGMLAAAISTVLVLLAGCGGGTGAGEAGGPSGPPRAGGTASFGMTGDVSGTFDPATMLSTSATIADGTVGYLLYGGLVHTDPDTREVVPRMARSLDSDDGTVWVLTLREGLRFSDGTPFDAEAVRVNWARHADPELSSTARGVVAAFSAVEVVDPVTVRITLTEANFQFPRSLALFSVNLIASPAAIRAGTLDDAPVGAGPFVLKDRLRDDRMTFARNPTYWDAPRPYLDELTLRPITDEAQRLNSAATGEIDGLMALTRIGATDGTDQGLELRRVPTSGGSSLYFNFDRPVPGDVRFRQALRLAIDNEFLNESIEQGSGIETSTFFAPETPFHDPAGAWPRPDLAAAQRLIDEMVAERGGPVRFTFLVSQRDEALGTAVQSQLAELTNLEVDLEIGSTFLPFQRQVEGNYEVSLNNNFNVDPEPRLGLLLQPGSPRNFLRYDNPEMTEALRVGRTTQDVEQRRAAYRQFDEIVNRDVPWVLLLRQDPNVLWDAGTLQDVTVFEDGIIFWDQVWRS